MKTNKKTIPSINVLEYNYLAIPVRKIEIQFFKFTFSFLRFNAKGIIDID